jgi:hypothetical protein
MALKQLILLVLFRHFCLAQLKSKTVILNEVG